MQTFSTAKPTAPGAYWVRNVIEGHTTYAALVIVARKASGLHVFNFGIHQEVPVESMDQKIEWCGPLVAAAPVIQLADAADRALAALDMIIAIDAAEDKLQAIAEAFTALEDATRAARVALR